jgi:hypothetical protein
MAPADHSYAAAGLYPMLEVQRHAAKNLTAVGQRADKRA